MHAQCCLCTCCRTNTTLYRCQGKSSLRTRLQCTQATILHSQPSHSNGAYAFPVLLKDHQAAGKHLTHAQRFCCHLLRRLSELEAENTKNQGHRNRYTFATVRFHAAPARERKVCDARWLSRAATTLCCEWTGDALHLCRSTRTSPQELQYSVLSE